MQIPANKSAISDDCLIVPYRRYHKDKDNFSTPNQSAPLMEEMKKMFEDLKVQQDSKFTSLKVLVTEISTQNVGIQKSIDFLSNIYDEVKQKVDILQNDYVKTQAFIKLLENKINSILFSKKGVFYFQRN